MQGCMCYTCASKLYTSEARYCFEKLKQSRSIMSPNIFVCNNVSTGDKVPYCLQPKDNLVVFKELRHLMTVSTRLCLANFQNFQILSIFCTIGSVYIVVSSKSVTRVYGKMLVISLVWLIFREFV